jgi:hypothetical protein
MKAITLMTLGLFIIFGDSCTMDKKDDNCPRPGYGVLKVSNTSANTAQKILIDGTNYGSLDPSKTVSYSLPAGVHTLQSVSLTGGSMSNQDTVIIAACKTEARDCR